MPPHCRIVICYVFVWVKYSSQSFSTLQCYILFILRKKCLVWRDENVSKKKKLPAAPGVYLAHFWEGLDILKIADQSTSNPIGSGSSDDLILIFHLWLLAWQWSTMLFAKDCPFGLIDAGFLFHSVLPSMSPLFLSSFYSWKKDPPTIGNGSTNMI